MKFAEPTRIINLERFSIHEVQPGQNFSLTCSVEKDHTLSATVTWLKNNQQIENNVEHKSVSVSDYVLNVFEATDDDSANYTCSAVTHLDAAAATVMVQVKT